MGVEDRMVKNEKLLRDWNQGAAKAIKNYYGHEKGMENEVLEFVCECSNMQCMHKISLSIKEYEAIHKRKDRFILANGHDNHYIEKIIKKTKNYEIVEKYRLDADV